MNRVAFSIIGIDIYWYSIFILLGVFISYYLITKESKKLNINQNFISNLIFYGIIIGILGARLYYVLFNLPYYLKYPSQILAFRNGGLAIHGGIITAVIFIYFYCKKHKENVLKILDIIVPGVIIAQAIGRWGNFFNMEAYGSATTYKCLKDLFIPEFIIRGMKINNVYHYPTFYFESLWCFVGFIIILFIKRKKNLKIGTITGFYFIWYSIGRFFIESLRTDSLMFLNLKVAQIVSFIGIILGLILILKKRDNNLENEVKK